MDISVFDTTQGLEYKMKKRPREQCDETLEDSMMSSVYSEDTSSMDNTLSKMDSTPEAAFIMCSKLESDTGQSQMEIWNSEGNVQEKEQNDHQKLSKKMDTEHDNGINSGKCISASSLDYTLSKMNSAPESAFVMCSKLELDTGQSHVEIWNSEGNVQEKEQNDHYKVSKKMDAEQENGINSGKCILASSLDNTLSKMDPAPESAFVKCSKLEFDMGQSHVEVRNSEGNVQEKEQNDLKFSMEMHTEHESGNGSGICILSSSSLDNNLSKMDLTPEAAFLMCSKVEPNTGQTNVRAWNSEGNVQEKEQNDHHQLTKKMDIEHENGHNSGKCNLASTLDNTLSKIDPTPESLFVMCSNLEFDTGQSHPEIWNSEGCAQEMEQNDHHKLSKKVDTKHESGNDSGNCHVNELNASQLVAKHDTEMEELSSISKKEDSMVPNDSSDLRDPDDLTRIPTVDQELSKEGVDERNDRTIIYQCTKENFDSFDHHLKCTVQDCEKDGSLKCLYVDQISGFHGKNTSQMILEGVVDASVFCSVDGGGNEASTSNELFTLTPCKPHEMENAETVKEEVTRFSEHGETSNDVHAIIKENTLSLMTDTSEKGDSIGCSRKKLLVLDVNGLLADFICYVPPGFKPDTTIGPKAVFKRPFCDDFLTFCFERFEVGVWSSRTRRNVDMVIDFLMGDFREKLLFCWDQSHCTDTNFNTVENMHKPLVLKELRKLWKFLKSKGDYNASNTLLLDDSPHKALCNPAHTAIFPITYRFRDIEDTSLGPGGDLRVYLEGLSMAENVQKYVEQNPFGQRPITEKNLSWAFYRRIIYFVERGNDPENATPFNCEW